MSPIELKQEKIRLQNSMIKLLSIADAITLTNATLGFLAIFLVLSNEFHLAASLIFLGLLADGLDGMVARHTRTGQIGESLESIADMITLSIAPLLLFYKVYSVSVASPLLQHLVLGGVLVFSFLCSMIRLSSFSILKEKQFFMGLPTSASAIFLVLFSYMNIDLLYVLPFIIVLGVAMVSRIHFPKPGLKMDLVAAAVIFLIIVLDSMYNNIAPWLLFLVLLVYVVAGPFYLRTKKI